MVMVIDQWITDVIKEEISKHVEELAYHKYNAYYGNQSYSNEIREEEASLRALASVFNKLGLDKNGISVGYLTYKIDLADYDFKIKEEE
jgi:hypothetical protein